VSGGQTDDHPRGEVGVLKKVQPAIGGSLDRCFLFIEYNGGRYLGCLFVTDWVFCRQTVSLLKDHVGEEISAVGALDVSHLL
jgi:hypothetical protein